MSKSRWSWLSAATALTCMALVAVVFVPASPAHFEDDEQSALAPLAPSADLLLAQSIIANGDDDSLSDAALAAYLGFPSRDAAFEPLEDPSWLDNH